MLKHINKKNSLAMLLVKKRLIERGVVNYHFGIKITLKLFLNTVINKKLTRYMLSE